MPKNALEPHISAQTLEYYYARHHASYVGKLTKLVKGSEFEDSTLEEIIDNASGNLFNNAAQAWNHNFCWNCLTPNGGGEPRRTLGSAIGNFFGAFVELTGKFSDAAISNFGSGWTWLAKAPDGRLEIVNTTNAGNPLTDGHRPLLTCDIWEHAYYIDYRNDRAEYLKAFWKLVNWDHASKQLG